jgi:hypothetical protein
MADDERRDDPRPNPEPNPDPSALREIEIDDLRHLHLVLWGRAINVETSWWQASMLEGRAERLDKPGFAAELDQSLAELRDATRRARVRLERIRRRLRRLEEDGRPSGPAPGATP